MGHLKEYEFKPGQSGNPKGKTPGTHNRSTRQAEALKGCIFTHALHKLEIELRGKPVTMRRIQIALTRLYADDPKAYADVILKAMPRNLDIDLTADVTTWASVIQEMDEAARASRAADANGGA